MFSLNEKPHWNEQQRQKKTSRNYQKSELCFHGSCRSVCVFRLKTEYQLMPFPHNWILYWFSRIAYWLTVETAEVKFNWNPTYERASNIHTKCAHIAFYSVCFLCFFAVVAIVVVNFTWFFFVCRMLMRLLIELLLYYFQSHRIRARDNIVSVRRNKTKVWCERFTRALNRKFLLDNKCKAHVQIYISFSIQCIFFSYKIILRIDSLFAFSLIKCIGNWFPQYHSLMIPFLSVE